MKIATLGLTTAAVGALLLAGAAPANAAGASLHQGDALYAIGCQYGEDTTGVYNDWQLLSVDAPTAVSVTIGDGDGQVSEDFDACGYQPAYNPATGVSYYIQVEYDDGGVYYLASIDVTTGVSTRIGEFYYWDNEFQQYPEVYAMAIGLDGKAYVLADNAVWSVDLTDGELTFVASTGDDYAYAFAVDPTTGKFYAVDVDETVFEVNVADGTFTDVDTVDFGEDSGSTYSLQIDGAGRFWIEVDYPQDVEDPVRATLWSFTLGSAATPVYSGIFTDDPYYTEGLLLIPAKSLPATGPADAGAGAIAAVALLALGGLLVAGHRIRRRIA